jgi:NADH:ubiquinone oxidoreductase subunit 6 (subunit J)
MPEPEFFIILIAAGAVFAVCAAIAMGLFVWGRRKKSKPLKIIAALALICGLIVLAPFVFLLLSWIWYWMFGSNK